MNQQLDPDSFDGHSAGELRIWAAVGVDLLVPFHYFGVSDDGKLGQHGWNRQL